MKLHHDCSDIRLRECHGFHGQYIMYRQKVEDWNKGDGQSQPTMVPCPPRPPRHQHKWTRHKKAICLARPPTCLLLLSSSHKQQVDVCGSRVLGPYSCLTQTPLTMVEGTPPGDALPPPQQRATPARKGARCGAGAGSRRPHRPHPGHTGRETLAACSRGRAAGVGTAPDTRRPSQRWQATPPGDGPPPPRGTQPPRGMQAKGTVLGPPTHTPAPTARGWRTPKARPVGRQLGEAQRLT